jgi:hypothetical protein
VALLVEDDPDGRDFAPPRSLNSVIVCSKQRTRIRPWRVAEHPDIAVLFTDARNAIMHRGVVDAAGPSPSDL